MTLPFDKIYCLHMAEDNERYELLEKELLRLDIKPQVEIWWTCGRNISRRLGNAVETLKTPYYWQLSTNNKGVMAGVFNCAFEHYTIVKQAYLRGFNSVLIMEDDIRFIDNIKHVEKAFNSIPDDYDLIKFWSTDYYLDNNMKFYNGEDNLYKKIEANGEIPVTSTLCYALSRNGMKKYIDIMDVMFIPADMPFQCFNPKKLNIYGMNYKFVFTDNTIKSTITGKLFDDELKEINGQDNS